jgi:hypothetical protein
MTGFSSEWLSLRESADHRARSVVLLKEVQQYFAHTQPGLGKTEHSPFLITDLGCGTGSNLRALAHALPEFQHWSLVDYDPLLLDAARSALSTWADSVVQHDSAKQPNPQLRLVKNGKQITVNFVQEDLSENIEHVLAKHTDLLTAAAFFDLVSPDWIVRFCKSLNAPLYTVLTYDGTEKWIPPHPTDHLVLDAFHAHQATDKGFGLSAGPGAIQIMQAQLTARSFNVQLEKSPWVLNHKDQALMQALATGSAGAVAETNKVPTIDLNAWLAAHLQAQQCEIGHWDLFARLA